MEACSLSAGPKCEHTPREMEPSLRPALGSVVDGASSHSGWEQMLATRKLITCRNYEFQGDKRDIKLKGIHNKTPERR